MHSGKCSPPGPSGLQYVQFEAGLSSRTPPSFPANSDSSFGAKLQSGFLCWEADAGGTVICSVDVDKDAMNADGQLQTSSPNGYACEMTCKKRDDYLEWPEYFMAVAFLSAQRSKDPNSQVGACIVNSENKIVGIGYNGMPNGCSDDLLPWTRTADNKLNTKYPYVCHAELNAIMNKNSADVKGCSIYVALFPCNECAKLIIQAGIKEVIFMSDKYHDTPEMIAARRLFDLAGILYTKFKPKCSKIIIDFDSINSKPSQKPL